MKKYTATFTKSIDVIFEVEANDSNEAMEKAIEKFNSVSNEERVKHPDFEYQSSKFEPAYVEEKED